SEWGADESLRKGTPAFAPITKLIVHHTVTPNDDPDPAATVRAMYAYHTRVRGWDDIGYNFLVDARGRVYEGRYARAYEPGEAPTGEDEDRRGVIGAHAEGANTGSAGVALLGDFTAAAPPPAAVAALEAWLAWKAARHRIDPLGSSAFTAPGAGAPRLFANIAGHRDVRATQCPGDRLYDKLPSIRLRAAELASEARVPRGYWIAGADGAVHPSGESRSLGDAGAAALASPIRGMALTRTQAGYWLLGGDGGIFSYGDARFFGSTGAMRLNRPVVGMAATPTGGGYWLVASDGGIFAFGDAAFRGSTGALRLNSPIAAMERSGDGTGYWLVARDGGVFAFGVPFRGSVPGLGLASYGGSAALRATADSLGYYVLGADGGVFAFGSAPFLGARPGLAGPSAAVDLAVLDVPG
ncbi:MAG TPA: peptidoglycan recognition family protein, partial [Acidimicrobiales bacterium]|nr:peptidoglycan recognition family protein [Acidimicrobiales bacterium]